MGEAAHLLRRMKWLQSLLERQGRMMENSDGGVAINHSDGTGIKIYRPGQYGRSVNVLNGESA